MISIRSALLGSRLSLAPLSTQVQRHRAIARIGVATLSLAVAAAVSVGGSAHAALTAVGPIPSSILPANVGVGVASDESVTLTFAFAMDRASVEAGLRVVPAQPVYLDWIDDGSLRVTPQGRWSTDTRYAVSVAAGAHSATGALLDAPLRFSFTTESAPRINEISLRFLPEQSGAAAVRDHASADATAQPSDTASGVSAESSIGITFSAPMNRDEVERSFLLTPAVAGAFGWNGNTLTFIPGERLAADARYAVSLAGVHDLHGNPLGGDASFSFTTRAGAQLVHSVPDADATGSAATEIELWFSQPMDPDAVAAALRVTDRSTGNQLTGSFTWSGSRTQLRFTPSRALPAGHRIDVSLAAGAADADGNPVAGSLTFTTRPAATRRAVPAAAPADTAVGYALNQVNAARAAYGLAPVVLDAAISAVALAHAWDQLNNGYFGHVTPNGSTTQDRLRAAGISFGWSGENLCYTNNSGRTVTGTLDWCQGQFMSEPYPGVVNHIGNILSVNYTRVGIAIAISGAKFLLVWDFAD